LGSWNADRDLPGVHRRRDVVTPFERERSRHRTATAETWIAVLLLAVTFVAGVLIGALVF
jgi:F0F1-type ATP synthase assembly protein I